jgi:hypothetical protein
VTTLSEDDAVARVRAAVGAADDVAGRAWAVRRMHLPGRGPHLEVDAARARALAGAGETAGVELVWRPSLVSKSSLYPVWEVLLPSGPAYVDQAGSVRHNPP